MVVNDSLSEMPRPRPFASGVPQPDMRATASNTAR
jgi:hypothetical protein